MTNQIAALEFVIPNKKYFRL